MPHHAEPRASADTRKSTQKRLASSPELERSLGYALRRAQLAFFAEYSARMKAFDLKPAQFAILMLIREHPGISQSAICAALDIAKANLVPVLDRLGERGWTERRPVPGDRRASALHLTAAGSKAVTAMISTHRKLERSVAKRLGSSRTAELLALLHNFCGAL